MALVRSLQENLNSSISVTQGVSPERLELLISWCNRTLRWQVLLSSPPELCAPDFLFDDPAFQPLVGSLAPAQLAQLQQQLCAWPAPSPEHASAGTAAQPSGGPEAVAVALASLVKLLLSLYREFQLSRLAALSQTQHSDAVDRLQFELSTLATTVPATPHAWSDSAPAQVQEGSATGSLLPPLDEAQGAGLGSSLASEAPAGEHGSAAGVAAGAAGSAGAGGSSSSSDSDSSSSALEVMYLEPRPGEVGKACLGLPLVGLDLSRLAAYEPRTRALTHAHVKLHVTFRLAPGQAEPDLHLQMPGWLRAVLPEVTLPSWTPHSCLMEYVPQTVERLMGVVNTLCDGLALRGALLDALSSALGGSRPLEVNLAAGTGLWSLAWEGTPVLLTVACAPPSTTGGPSFPEEQPALTLSAVRQLGCGPDTTSRTYRTYPWSPRWPPAEMASRITSWLASELPVFLGAKPAAPPIVAAAATPALVP